MLSFIKSVSGVLRPDRDGFAEVAVRLGVLAFGEAFRGVDWDNSAAFLFLVLCAVVKAFCLAPSQGRD